MGGVDDEWPLMLISLQLPQNWKYNQDTPFYNILVPTVDTVRNSFVVSTLINAHKHVLLVGNTGTGKTATVQSLLSSAAMLDSFATLTINFSGQTTYVGNAALMVAVVMRLVAVMVMMQMAAMVMMCMQVKESARDH